MYTSIYEFCSSCRSLGMLSKISDPPICHLYKDNNGKSYLKEIFCENYQDNACKTLKRVLFHNNEC